MNRRQLVASYLLHSVLLIGSTAAFGEDVGDADSQEVGRYHLTDAKLAKYAAATRGLADALADDPASCEEDDADSLTAMAARLDDIPEAKAALAGAGMPSREYIVFGLAVLQAGMASWALSQGGALPPGVSAENVGFYQAHQDEIQALTSLLPEDSCGDDGDGGDWDDGEPEDDSDF